MKTMVKCILILVGIICFLFGMAFIARMICRRYGIGLDNNDIII